jgi:hypothetical protein
LHKRLAPSRLPDQMCSRPAHETENTKIEDSEVKLVPTET